VKNEERESLSLLGSTDMGIQQGSSPVAAWQPIETAPKDVAILGFAQGACAVVRWQESALLGYWLLIVAGTYAEDAEWHPTHWTPLPHVFIPDATGTVCFVCGGWPSESEHISVPRCLNEADARLIAAAPDLLAACKAALWAFERNDCIDWDDLSRAIRKAEGEATDVEDSKG
jgi:hypothetical protein